MLDLLFFAAVAAFLAFRFYNTIGKKDHSPDERIIHELRKAKRQAESDEKSKEEDEKVITLRPEEVKLVDETPLSDDVQIGVGMIQKYEPDFDAATFLKGATRAFEMIVDAYAKADKETLENLLEEELYKEFVNDIDAREKEGKELSVTLISEPKVRLEDIKVKGKEAKVTVEFDSREIRLIKDDKGRILEGDPSDAERVTDRWTFAKKLDKKTTIWKLVDTEAV